MMKPPPLPDGLLTHEHRTKFQRWINSKAALIGKCPVCGERNFTVLDHFVDLPIHRGGTLVAGGPSYPNVGLLCQNCGTTQLVNAVMSGIVGTGSEEPQSIPQGEKPDGKP